MKHKIISVALILCLLVSALALGTVTSVTASTGEAETQYARGSIQGGAVLHCFNWSYNNIKANLAAIKAAGYTAVQTSPVQAPKNYNANNTGVGNEWWKLYQPLGFTVADGNTWLGTRAQLQSLCTEAEEYGIKVIVDVVANHLANNGTDGGTYAYINDDVEEDMKNADYYHTNNIKFNENSRYNLTQYHMGMPDLNTANTYVQTKVLNFLKDCVDVGVDGFRFDAAKHIELPSDPANCRSDFWPNVVNGIKEYSDDVFIYGEILGGAGTAISNYTEYMAVTDNQTGDLALEYANNGEADKLSSGTYKKGASASDSILWVESHDTYMGTSAMSSLKNTYNVSNDIITRAWAIVASRADSTSLYFARHSNVMGKASTDTTWKSAAVTEVNKFKNFFSGASEKLSYSENTTYNERGTSGVVISKLDGSGDVSLTAKKMADGTYYDQITNNKFTVEDGVISGKVGSTGVAVVYNPTENPVITPTYNTVKFKNTQDWSKVYLYAWNGNENNGSWPGVQLTEKATGSDGKEVYTAEFDLDFNNIIFNNGSGEQTVDIAYDNTVDGYYPTETNTSGKWKVETFTDEEPVDNKNIYTDSDGKEIDLDETISREADDTALTGIGNEFKNLQILGVQKKKNTAEHDIRFVTVVNNDIIKDADDYGYIAVSAQGMENARSAVEGLTLDKAPAKHIFRCKDTNNNISGDYGKSTAVTKYKYVTCAVNNIGDNAAAVMFYVKDKNGNVFYAPYTNSSGTTYNSCSADWDALT